MDPNLKTPADYQLWETFIQRDGAGDNFIIRPKNPHVMYKGDLNPEWAAFQKETFHLWFYGQGNGLEHPAVYKLKELIFSGKGPNRKARLKRPAEMVLEDDDTEDGIMLNLIYDCDWCDMSDDSMNRTIAYLKANYIVQRREKQACPQN